MMRQKRTSKTKWWVADVQICMYRCIGVYVDFKGFKGVCAGRWGRGVGGRGIGEGGGREAGGGRERGGRGRGGGCLSRQDNPKLQIIDILDIVVCQGQI